MSAHDLQSIARALGGEVSGHQVLAPGPGHSARDRSLAVKPHPRVPGSFLVYSFSGDDPFEVRDYVRRKLGLSRSIEPPRTFSDRVSAISDKERSSAQTFKRAMAIWAEARDPRGTPVETYLHHRGLDLPAEAAGKAMRYHPACPFGSTRTPARVCLVRDVRTDEPRAIHRTALTVEGLKTTIGGRDRLTLAQTAGGAIKFTPNEDVTTCLGLGEGVESALSLRLAREFGPSPVWSLLSAPGIGRLRVLPGIECLWIAVDHDPAGIKAAESCSDRWRKKGRRTFLLKPHTEGLDLNDIAKGERVHA